METAQMRLNAKLGELKSSANNMITMGKDSMREAEQLTLNALGEAANRLGDVVRKTRIFIRENPAVSAAAVVMAGIIVAKLVSGRSNIPHRGHPEQKDNIH